MEKVSDDEEWREALILWVELERETGYKKELVCLLCSCASLLDYRDLLLCRKQSCLCSCARKMWAHGFSVHGLLHTSQQYRMLKGGLRIGGRIGMHVSQNGAP
jgi:hypothetical protein